MSKRSTTQVGHASTHASALVSSEWTRTPASPYGSVAGGAPGGATSAVVWDGAVARQLAPTQKADAPSAPTARARTSRFIVSPPPGASPGLRGRASRGSTQLGPSGLGPAPLGGSSGLVLRVAGEDRVGEAVGDHRRALLRQVLEVGADQAATVPLDRRALAALPCV